MSERFTECESGEIEVNGQRLRYRIVQHNGWGERSASIMGHDDICKNGYIIFPKRPVRESGYDGILAYVPVHGGITWANEKEDGSMEYGFDTLHYDSESFPRNDANWIKEQIMSMAKGILRAAEVEDKYLRCVSNKGRAKHADYVRGDGDQEIGFGALINVLGGKL